MTALRPPSWDTAWKLWVLQARFRFQCCLAPVSAHFQIQTPLLSVLVVGIYCGIISGQSDTETSEAIKVVILVAFTILMLVILYLEQHSN